MPQNYAEAVKWRRLAAEQGDAVAQVALGAMYALGNGVPQNYIQSYLWYSLAAAQGHTEIANKAVKLRDETASKMTPAQLAEAQKLAAQWRPKTPEELGFKPAGAGPEQAGEAPASKKKARTQARK